MTHPIKLMANLCPKSNQIDGTGFGGVVADKLEVAGALGMRNPNTGEKVKREAYNLARLVYCHDGAYRYKVRASLIAGLQSDAGKITSNTVYLIACAALSEFIKPHTKLNKNGEPEYAEMSKVALAKKMGLHHSSLTERHELLYRLALQEIWCWSSEAIQHIKLCLDDSAT